MEFQSNPPYSLFQNPVTSLWGTKDKDGAIQDEPVYKKSEVPGYENTFGSIDGCSIVEFNPETGMDIVAWNTGPWYDDAWGLAFYPKGYDSILWGNIKSKKHFTNGDSKVLESIELKCSLTEQQKSILHLLDLFYQLEDEINEPIELELEEKILNDKLKKLDSEERLQIILPLMDNPQLTEEEKSILYFGIFMLNYRLTYL